MPNPTKKRHILAASGAPGARGSQVTSDSGTSWPYSLASASHQHALCALAWRLDAFCGPWERHSFSLLEEHGPVLVRHIVVHQRAVPESLDVRYQALGLAPGHLADLAAWQRPRREAR